MSKLVTIILILASLFLAGLCVFVMLLDQNTQTSHATVQTVPTPTITTLHALTLSPHSQQVKQGQINTVAIILETQNSTVTQPRLLQMEIAYDPQAISDVDIMPGEFFNNPTISLKTINANTGRISYAIEESATETSQRTSGVAARLTFIPNPSFAGRETTLSFLGKTIIRSTTDTDILTATYGTKLFFATASATPR